MGGGKSRALCEDVFQDMLNYPGIQIPIFRNSHISLLQTTRRTMTEEVIPPQLLTLCKVRASGGEDYIRLPNGSTVHFAGLEDPVRWFSSELGGVGFDEAHEIPEDAVVKIITRLRQRGMPRTIRICFNPDNPGHWLYQWIFVGADKTHFGRYKSELRPTDAVGSVGDLEFIFARATDNPFLPEDYTKQELGGLPEHLRRRYLEGIWEFIGGKTYFDIEALSEYREIVPQKMYRGRFETLEAGTKARMVRRKDGPISVYEEPNPELSYAIGADVATGRGADYSCAYVIRLDEPKIVAEFHAKIDADLYAEQLHFLGRWYCDALMAIETGGGFGEAVIIPLRDGKGPRPPYPRLYRHVLSSRPDIPMVKPYGFPMNVKTRPLVLSQLEKAIRERSLPGLPQRLLDECLTFVYADTAPSPRALDNCNDDAVFAGAIALEMYRLRGHHPERYKPRPHVARSRRVYPWQRRSKEALAAEIEARYPKGT